MPDQKLFREIVEQNKQRVYYLALHLTGDHDQAEDLSQEVFMNVYRALDRFRGQASISSWLYRITVNAFIDKNRKKKLPMMSLHDTETRESGYFAEPVSDDTTANPEQAIKSRMIREHVERALNCLSPREKTAFVLKHYQDQPIKEVARIIRTSEGTVKSLLFRAIRKLQRELSFYKEEVEAGGRP